MTSVEEVRYWWQERPDDHVGLACGYHSGVLGGCLVVIDPDTREAMASLDASGLVTGLGYRVTTGKGWHIYGLTPFPVTSSNGALCSKIGSFNIDVRGYGGYVKAPNQLHVSGRLYVANGEMGDICEVSRDLADLLEPFTLPASGQIVRRRTERSSSSHRGLQANVDPGSLPLLEDIPLSLLEKLSVDPPKGHRNGPAFSALLHLVRLTPVDDEVAGTIVAFPVGKRYLERNDNLRHLYEDILRARKKSEFQGRTKWDFRAIEAHMRAAQRAGLNTATKSRTTYRVLLGYYELAKASAFVAAMGDVAIRCGMNRKTVSKHTERLLSLGWLTLAYEGDWTKGHARRYCLSYPEGVTPPSRNGEESNYWPSFSQPAFSNVGCDQLGLALRAGGPGDPGYTASAAVGEYDLSQDGARWRATGALWTVIPFIGLAGGTTVNDILSVSGMKRSTVYRQLKRGIAFGIILRTDDGYCLAADYEDRLADVAARKKTAGRKRKEVRDLDLIRQAGREKRRRAKLLETGQGILAEDGLHVIDTGTGEVV